MTRPRLAGLRSTLADRSGPDAFGRARDLVRSSRAAVVELGPTAVSDATRTPGP